MGEGDDALTGHKAHRPAQKGRKAERKAEKGGKGKVQEGVDPRIRNPKAFAINSAVRAERKFRRAQDLETKKDRVPLVDRSPVEAPPFVVAIVGPPKVGKSTLLMNLVKNYTRQALSDIKGPVTIVTGKKRRLTIIECNNDINSMIDVAKVADLCLLLVDASFGFEMEVFEFLNICQVHGFPQIMGVLTHLDLFRNKKKLKKTKKTLKHRFWTEVYPGAKLFYLSGYFPMTQTYPKNEVHNLARFISVMKFRPTVWRTEHAYLVADRMEDLTQPEYVRVDPKVDRTICLYGYVHGTFLKQHVSVHIPGLGDFTPEAITALDDPCPLPAKHKAVRRTLTERDKVIYAPFSGVGGIVYDQDAVYIDLGGSHSHHANQRAMESGQEEGGAKSLVAEMRGLKTTLDEKMELSKIKMFSNSKAITAADIEMVEENEAATAEYEETGELETPDLFSRNFTPVVADDGRIRRRVEFEDVEDQSKSMDDDGENDEDNDDDEDDEEELTKSMQRDVMKLKKISENEARGKSDKKKDSAGSGSSEDESEDEESDEDDPDSRMKPQSKSRSNPQEVEDRSNQKPETISSIVSKLKTKLKSSNEIAMSTKRQGNEEPNKTNRGEAEIEYDEDSAGSDYDDVIVDKINHRKETDLTDESDADNEDQETESDDDEETEDKSKSMEISQSDDETQNVRKLVEKSSSDKEQRYSLAEEAFYSRYKNRSIQKMIYDDAEDYMNVTSRSDFDLANSAVKEQVQEFDDDEMKDLFIGGDYAETAKNILDEDDNSDDGMFGDFEELDDDDNDQDKKMKEEKSEPEDEHTTRKKRDEMKKKLKEKFDMDYDGGGDDDKAFYKDWKAQVEEQTKVNKTFFNDVEDSNLLRDLQGLAPGTYVRVEISRIPCEFVVNFDAQRCCPLIVGSLDSPNQETLAVVQARVKKHRWHPKILKTRDPVIMSVGWRRFQTVVLYSVQDHNSRNRMIKYTPDHLHCIANFYGPMTPQGTGILGIAPSGFDGFRITLTGTILDMDKSSELVKKLKLVGTPAKIFKKSAFIEGMFSSQLEVAKFVGAKIKTVSGIRGVIKRELRTPLGAFRATFEDKIVQSDIVFCRTWAKVDVPPFYLNIPTHVVAQPRVMKTVGQLKREQQLQIEPSPDHLYTPIEREAKRFKPLKIPKRLQEKLPYKDKPKVLAKLNAPKRIAVIKDPQEREMTKFLRTLKTRMSDKEAKEKAEKAKKATEREKVVKKLEGQQDKRQKELRKKVFRTLGLINKSKENGTGGSSGGGRRRPPKHKRQ